jgi:predicted PurR-regulated permease PerM
MLWQVRAATVLFMLSLAVAAAFRPATEYWLRRGRSPAVALLMTYGLTVLLVGALLVTFGGALVVELGSLVDDLSAGYEVARLAWPEEGNAVQRLIADQLPPLALLYNVLSGEQATDLARMVAGVATDLFDTLGSVVIVVILSAYWSLGHVQFERLWLSLLAAEHRARARDIWRETERQVGAHVRSEAFTSLVVVALLWPGYRLLGVQHAAIAALLAGFLRLIPWLGVPLVLLVSLGVGLGEGLVCGVCPALYAGLVLAGVEIAARRMLLERRRTTSLITAFMVIALGWTFGLGGAILAPLLSLALQHIVVGMLQPLLTSPVSEPLDEADDLRGRLERVRERMIQEGTAATPATANLLQRLEGLMDRADSLRE